MSIVKVDAIFGKLTIVRKELIRPFWLCKCKCGKLVRATTNELKDCIVECCSSCKRGKNGK